MAVKRLKVDLVAHDSDGVDVLYSRGGLIVRLPSYAVRGGYVECSVLDRASGDVVFVDWTEDALAIIFGLISEGGR